MSRARSRKKLLEFDGNASFHRPAEVRFRFVPDQTWIQIPETRRCAVCPKVSQLHRGRIHICDAILAVEDAEGVWNMFERLPGELPRAVDFQRQRRLLFGASWRRRAIFNCASTRAISSRAEKGLVR